MAVGFASSISAAATVGVPRYAHAYPVGSFTPSTTFGVASFDYDLETYAESVESSALFGEAFVRAYAPVVTQAAAGGGRPLSVVGTPTMQGRLTAAPAGIVATTVGTPIYRAKGTATATSGGLFGTPHMRGIGHVAVPPTTTVLGLATVRRIGRDAGLKTSPRFGAASARATADESHTGGATTTMGQPSAVQRHLARSLRVRPQMGTPLTVRTQP